MSYFNIQLLFCNKGEIHSVEKKLSTLLERRDILYDFMLFICYFHISNYFYLFHFQLDIISIITGLYYMVFIRTLNLATSKENG